MTNDYPNHYTGADDALTVRIAFAVAHVARRDVRNRLVLSDYARDAIRQTRDMLASGQLTPHQSTRIARVIDAIEAAEYKR